MTLEELYRNNKDRYIRKVYPYLYNVDVCEDIVQSAFSKALSRFETYKPEKGKLQTWFNSVLFSVLWDYKRSLRRTPHMLDIIDFLESEDLAYYEDTSLKDILKEVSNKQHQKMLVANLVLGYSYKETSEHLGVTQDNVRKVVQRFREGYTNGR